MVASSLKKKSFEAQIHKLINKNIVMTLDSKIQNRESEWNI